MTTKKQKGGATAAMSSILGALSLEQVKPQSKIIEAKTAECRMWHFADRPEEEAEHIDEVRESIKAVGQIHPVLARPCNDPEASHIKYEVIVGKVRFKSCDQLEIPLRLEVRNIDDRQANRIMVAENDKRKGISIYARSLHLARCLEEGLYKNKKELSDDLDLSPSTLSYHLAFASLPESIIKALGNMRPITLAMGYRIAQAVEKFSEDEVMALIPDIRSGNLSAAQLEAMMTERDKEPIVNPNKHPQAPELPESPDDDDIEPQETDGDTSSHPSKDDQGGEEDVTTDQDNNQLVESPQTTATLPDTGDKSKEIVKSETDLERANKLRDRITDNLSVVCTDEGTIVISATHPGLTYFLINNQRFIQDQLLNRLQEQAVSFLENEVPLDLFDDVS